MVFDQDFGRTGWPLVLVALLLAGNDTVAATSLPLRAFAFACLCLCVPLPLRDPLVHNVYVTPCFLSYMSQHSDFGSSAERADWLITKKWNIAFRLQGTSIQVQLGDGNIFA